MNEFKEKDNISCSVDIHSYDYYYYQYLSSIFKILK